MAPASLAQTVKSLTEPPKRVVPPVHPTPTALARRLVQICMGVVADALAGSDLTPLQYGAMRYLADEPDIDQNGLAARLGVEQSHASLIVDELVAMGLLDRRVNSDDRRARLLRLTRRGHELQAKVRPAVQAAHRRMLRPLDPKDRPLLLKLLLQVVEGNRTFARPGSGRRRPGSRQSSSNKT
jgi:MarR family transcriptional regulator, temperature-dependent positive regulator of motility